MPKYLKGFKSGRSSGLAPVSPRAWKPVPPARSSDGGLEIASPLGPALEPSAGRRARPPAQTLVPAAAVAGPPLPGPAGLWVGTPNGVIVGALLFTLNFSRQL